MVYIAEDHPEIVNTIVHESVHVFQAAMTYAGETTPGNETEAYSIAEIATNLMAHYLSLKEEHDALHEKGPKDGEVSS